MQLVGARIAVATFVGVTVVVQGVQVGIEVGVGGKHNALITIH